MKKEIFNKNNMLNMDPMHDSIADNFSIKDETLIINYHELDKGVLGPDGLPYYKFKNLSICYKYESYCEVMVYSKNKYKSYEIEDFIKKFCVCKFESYKYYVDSFHELKLEFTIRKCKNNRPVRIEVCLDPIEIIYSWE